MAAAEQRDGPFQSLEFALVAMTVALAPMNYLRLTDIYLTLSDVTGFCALMVMMANGRLPLRCFGQATGLWMTSFGLLVGGLLLGSLVNGDPTAGILMFLQYSYSLILLPLILAARPREQLVVLLKIFAFSVAVIMVHGAYLMHFVENPDMRLVSGSGRLQSLIERENAAAAIAAIAATVTLWLFLVNRIRATTLVIVFPIIVYGVLLTGSNTGLLGLLAGTLCLVLVGSSPRVILATLVTLGVVAAAALLWGEYFLPEVFQRRVMTALVEQDIGQAGTFVDRLMLVYEAFRIADGTIVIGLGADQYRELSEFGAPVHNTYLLVLSEGGLISLLGLTGLFVTGIYLGWAAMQHRNSYLDGALTLTVVVFFALLFNTVAHFYARFWNVPLILTMALSASWLPVQALASTVRIRP